ncbi:MAG: TetR family transcriptional regulator [Alphaproteobacteria bacterium]|nr:TetR family transcriptional regulator [Alphaproteobacteria bacterium]
MARTRAADYEDRREAILDHAANLFAARGFEGASISDLAKACKTSKSLLYHYYPSKEDLLYWVMSSHIDALLGAASDLAVAEGGAPERLARLVTRFLQIYVGAASRHKVLLNELRSLPAARRAEIIAKQRSVIAAVERLLTAVRPDLAKDARRARAVTMLCFGMINWTSNWLDPSGPLDAEEIARLATSIMLGGVETLRAAPAASAPLTRRSRAPRHRSPGRPGR